MEDGSRKQRARIRGEGESLFAKIKVEWRERERGKLRGKINEPCVSGPRGTYTSVSTANKRFVLFSVRVCMCVCFEVDFSRVN